MLLVGAKSVKIVKVGDTIEDGLKIWKIVHVAALLRSLGLFKKRREDVLVVSYEGKKTLRTSSLYKGRSRPSQSLYQACYTQAYYQNTPPSIY